MTYDTRSSAYRDVDVLGSSPERLVSLLHEHLLVSLKRASLYIRREDIEGKFESVDKAADIVAELRGVLDFEAGGDLSVRLSSLYGYWATEISASASRLDADRMDRVAAMVGELHDSWESAARALESGDQTVPQAEVTG